MKASFSARLLRWFEGHGRHDLPWQSPRTPYRVWLAEIMLQQTQVSAVTPYFQRFVARFPELGDLAAAPADDVLQAWAGLGYYARARNLQRAAQMVVAEHHSELPRTMEELMALPGIGRSTAAAILAQAHGQRQAILDGNVRRVLARQRAVPGWPGESPVAARLWKISEKLLPRSRLADYTQAIMDLGATICAARAPACERCPVRTDCQARLRGRIAEFPAPRPRRARPRRQAQLLLVEHRGDLLFERRPPAGIWGGLWCPPVIELEEDAAEVLLSRYGLRARAAGTLPLIKHAFTHFELRLTPRRLRAAGEVTAIAERGGLRWINMERDALPGLPAPVASLLDRLHPGRQSLKP